MAFTIDDNVFSNIKNSGMISDSALQAQIDLINKSSLMVDLLTEYVNADVNVDKILYYNADKNKTDPGTRDISINDVSDLARILGHELGHFADWDLHTTSSNNFSDVINAETDEARATAVSFVIRQQIIAANGGVNPFSVATENGVANGVFRDGANQDLLNRLESTYGPVIGATSGPTDLLIYAYDTISTDFWGYSYPLVRPGHDNGVRLPS